MSDRRSIAQKLMELSGLAQPAPPPVMEPTPRKYPVWQGFPAVAPETGQYAPVAGPHPSENIEDRRDEIGGARRALAIREGIDRQPKFIAPWADPTLPPNELSRAAGLDQVAALEQAANNREIARMLEADKAARMLEEDQAARMPMTEEEKMEAGIPPGYSVDR